MSTRPGGISKEKEEQVKSFIREELLFGRTFEEIVEKVRRKVPLIQLNTAKNWVQAVVEAIAITRASIKEGREFRMGLADQRYHQLYEKAIAAGDLKTALSIHTHWVKLHGLEAKKPSNNPQNVIAINTRGKNASIVSSGNTNMAFIGEEEDQPIQVPNLSTDQLRKIANVEYVKDTREAEIVQGGADDATGVGTEDAADREGDGRGGEGGEAGQEFDPSLG
ncbi:MAG: hypothetical protein E6Q97_12065 [Desulfurellales bacterium]|nr:MAG: hypothetical protein E6Q97_12065 [Desulfurellales bacterium]